MSPVSSPPSPPVPLAQQQQQPMNVLPPPATSKGRDRSASLASIKSTTSSRFKEQLYKTEMCRYMVEANTCKYGDTCRFAHSETELRTIGQRENYRTETCHEFSAGMCYFGWRCWFRHEHSVIDDDTFQATMVDLFFNPFLADYLEKIVTPFLGPGQPYQPLPQ